MSAGWVEPAVVIITGIQAAGKTTIGRLLAQRLERSAFIDGDVIARMVVGGGEGMTRDPTAEAVRQLRLRYRIAALAADAFHQAGFTAVHADNIYGQDVVAQIELLRSKPVLLVVLIPTDRAVVAREVGRGTGAYRDWMQAGGLDPAVADFQDYLAATPRIGLWLDTTDHTPDQTVDGILERAWVEGRVR